MDNIILQLVYRSIMHLLNTYYTGAVKVEKPESIIALPANTDVVSVSSYKSGSEGTLILYSQWEGVISLAGKISGVMQTEHGVLTAGANTELLNMLMGVIKRFYDLRSQAFVFSLPSTMWHGEKLQVTHNPGDHELYSYPISFAGFKSTLILILNKKK